MMSQHLCSVYVIVTQMKLICLLKMADLGLWHVQRVSVGDTLESFQLQCCKTSYGISSAKFRSIPFSWPNLNAKPFLIMEAI